MCRFVFLIALAALAVVGSSCSGFRGGNDAEVSANTVNSSQVAGPEAGSGKAAADQEIRKVDFKNFTYEPSMCGGSEAEKLTVKNGEFSYEKQEEGYVDRLHFSVFAVSYGDLTGDNSEEAIVLTVCNTGGTGNFTEGFVFTLKDNKPVLQTRIPGGDRAHGGLRKAWVENGKLVVESNDVGETGGACCPEFIVTSRYDASGGKLKQIGKDAKRPLYPSERVSFAKGTTGTTITAKLAANEGKRYIVGARAGQTLDVSVNTDKVELRLLEDAEMTNNTKGFSALLPKNGDYTIEVANYEDSPLEIKLNIRIR